MVHISRMLTALLCSIVITAPSGQTWKCKIVKERPIGAESTLPHVCFIRICKDHRYWQLNWICFHKQKVKINVVWLFGWKPRLKACFRHWSWREEKCVPESCRLVSVPLCGFCAALVTGETISDVTVIEIPNSVRWIWELYRKQLKKIMSKTTLNKLLDWMLETIWLNHQLRWLL